MYLNNYPENYHEEYLGVIAWTRSWVKHQSMCSCQVTQARDPQRRNSKQHEQREQSKQDEQAKQDQPAKQAKQAERTKQAEQVKQAKQAKQAELR